MPLLETKILLKQTFGKHFEEGRHTGLQSVYSQTRSGSSALGGISHNSRHVYCERRVLDLHARPAHFHLKTVESKMVSQNTSASNTFSIKRNIFTSGIHGKKECYQNSKINSKLHQLSLKYRAKIFISQSEPRVIQDFPVKLLALKT